MSVPDSLVTMRLFADMRQSALKLRGLETPDANARAKAIRDPAVFHALCVLLQAAQTLVSGPDEDALFWHPARECLTAAERRFEKLRSKLSAEAP